MKTQFYTFLPFIAFFIILTFWKFRKGTISNGLPFIIGSFLLTIDFLHPSIINAMVDSLSCVKIDEKDLLKIDYFYECYTQDHLINVIVF